MSLLCKEFLIKIILVSFKCQNRNYIKSTLSIRKLVSKIRKCGTDSVLWVISTPPQGKEWAFHFSHIEQILIISIQSERRSLLINEPSFLVLSHLNSSRGWGRGENGPLTCVQYTISLVSKVVLVDPWPMVTTPIPSATKPLKVLNSSRKQGFNIKLTNTNYKLQICKHYLPPIHFWHLQI